MRQLSVIALTSLPANLLAGVVLGKVKTIYGGIAFTAFLSMSAFCLLLVDRISIAILFAVLQGITQGIQVIWVGLVWPDYFGMRHLGSIRGFAMSATVISSALGPLLFGAVFDLTSSYRLILILSVVISLFGLALSVFSRPPTQKVFKNDYLP